MFKRVIDRRWILTTLLVIVISIVFIRLGFWQLDRLQARKNRVAAVISQMNAPVLTIEAGGLYHDWSSMEYRKATVEGVYDAAGEVVLRNQVWVDNNNVHHNGVHLLTPLIISGSKTGILVDRGWIPANEALPALRAKYNIGDQVAVSGVLRTQQAQSEMGLVVEPTLAVGETRRDVWNFANVEGIARQLDYPILPVYLQLDSRGEEDAPPYAQIMAPDLSEGAHLGFAFQWFALAGILLIGYPILLSKQTESEKTSLQASDDGF